MEHFFTFLKGFAMGAANVIPGVSGGTIAFITGIYERLIGALKSFDVKAVRLLMKFDLAGLSKHVDLGFLAALALGLLVSVLSLARVLKWGFEYYPVLVWSFFFGLIVASLPAVGKLVKRWSMAVVIACALGAALAFSMAWVTPASENSNFFYLMLCGVVAMCSMIIPGLSGSFVLLLMGNYKLIMIDSVNALSDGNIVEALKVLLPVGIGAIIGMLLLARFLSWLFREWHDVAVALITGFIAGSLVIIWPWKDTVTEKFIQGGATKEKITGFENWHLPDFQLGSTWAAILVMLFGVVMIVIMEKLASRKSG